MDARKERGRMIAEAGQVKRMGAEWFVPSASGSGKYIVRLDPDLPRCSCPDWELREMPCKHIYAVEFTLGGDLLALHEQVRVP